jgi:hypothetical protein
MKGIAKHNRAVHERGLAGEMEKVGFAELPVILVDVAVPHPRAECWVGKARHFRPCACDTNTPRKDFRRCMGDLLNHTLADRLERSWCHISNCASNIWNDEHQ